MRVGRFPETCALEWAYDVADMPARFALDGADDDDWQSSLNAEQWGAELLQHGSGPHSDAVTRDMRKEAAALQDALATPGQRALIRIERERAAGLEAKANFSERLREASEWSRRLRSSEAIAEREKARREFNAAIRYSERLARWREFEQAKQRREFHAERERASRKAKQDLQKYVREEMLPMWQGHAMSWMQITMMAYAMGLTMEQAEQLRKEKS